VAGRAVAQADRVAGVETDGHAFDQVLASEGIQCLKVPPRSPNLNAFAERWMRSVKEACLSKLILFGESSLRRALTEFVTHYEYAS